MFGICFRLLNVFIKNIKIQENNFRDGINKSLPWWFKISILKFWILLTLRRFIKKKYIKYTFLRAVWIPGAQIWCQKVSVTIWKLEICTILLCKQIFKNFVNILKAEHNSHSNNISRISIRQFSDKMSWGDHFCF